MKQTPAPKLIYLDEFRSLIQQYDKEEISMSKFCEVINKKAEKIVAQNAELLEALERALTDFKNSTWTEDTYDLIERTIQKATKP